MSSGRTKISGKSRNARKDQKQGKQNMWAKSKYWQYKLIIVVMSCLKNKIELKQHRSSEKLSKALQGLYSIGRQRYLIQSRHYLC